MVVKVARTHLYFLFGSAVLLSLYCTREFTNVGNLGSVGLNFVWFIFGVLFGQTLLRFAQQNLFLLFVPPVVLLVPSMAALYLVHSKQSHLFMVASFAGILMGIAVSSALSRSVPKVARIAAMVGKRSIGVYVLHYPILALIHTAMIRYGHFLLYSGWRSLLYVGVLDAVLLAVCVALGSFIVRWAPGLLGAPWTSSGKR